MKTFHTLSVISGIILLAALIWSIGFEPLWRNLIILGWGLVPLVLIEGVAELFHTIGWRHCLSEPHRSLPYFQIFQIRLAGSSINYLTPTAALGGEVTKGTLLAIKHPGPGAATAVIIDKLSHALSQLLFAVTGSVVVLWELHLPKGLWTAMLSGSALLGLGILGFLVVQKYGKLGAIVRWLAGRKLGGGFVAKYVPHINEVDHALKCFYREQPGDFPLSMLWHIVGMACGIVQSWYFLYLLTPEPSWLTAAGVWFLGSWFDLLSFAIPHDIGVLEASRTGIFRILGFEWSVGLSYGVALRLEQLFWAAVGLAFYMALLSEGRAKTALSKKTKRLACARPEVEK